MNDSEIAIYIGDLIENHSDTGELEGMTDGNCLDAIDYVLRDGYVPKFNYTLKERDRIAILLDFNDTIMGR